MTDITRRTAMKRFLAGGAGLTLGGSLLAACGSDEGSGGGGGGGEASGEPVKVGVLTDLTGAFGVVGVANRAVAEFTRDEINAAGGVLGRPIELVVVDGASDPAVNARVAGQLVNRDRVDMVIGGITSAEREAVRGIITDRGKTLFIWPASYEGGNCGDLHRNVGAVPNQQVVPTVDHLLEGGAETFFLCGNDYSYPREVLKAARQRIEAGGGRVVDEQYIPIDATDAPELVSRVISSRADALFEVVILPASVPFIRGVVDGGYEGKIAGTLLDESIIPLFGRQADGLIGAQDFFKTIEDPFSNQKVKEFEQRFPKITFGSTFNSPAWYRGLHLWRLAAEKAGTVDSADVDKAMDDIGSTELIGGPAKFVPGTRHCELSMYLGELQAGGEVEVLDTLGQITPEGQCA